MDGRETVWPLLNILKEDSEIKLGLVILNQPLKDQFDIFKKVWNKAAIKASVDGGTNELYESTGNDREKFLPDIITGDFDSIAADVLEFYKGKGADVIKTDDQNYNDFTKCLKLLIEKKMENQVSAIVTLGAFGGRVDQVFANIDTLFAAQRLSSQIQTYLLSEHSLACLLPKGKHRLLVDSGYEGEWCGLIPIAGSCDCVTTTGLKWNLDGQQLKFGELISTSNTWVNSGVVTIETDSYLLWTMGVKL